MEVTLEYIQTLAAHRQWNIIKALAESRDWPEEPGSVPLFLGMAWYESWTTEQGLGFDRALDHVERCYRSWPAPVELAATQLTEVSLRAEAGDVVKAMQLLQTEPLSGSREYEWHVLQSWAACHRQLRQWDEALPAFERAIQVAGDNRLRHWQSTLDRAMTLVEAGNLHDACHIWELADPPERFRGMYHLLGAEIHAKRANPKRALREGALALMSLQLSDRLNTGMATVEYRARAHLAMALAHASMGETHKALRRCWLVGGLQPLGCPPSILWEANDLGRRLKLQGGCKDNEKPEGRDLGWAH